MVAIAAMSFYLAVFDKMDALKFSFVDDSMLRFVYLFNRLNFKQSRAKLLLGGYRPIGLDRGGH